MIFFYKLRSYIWFLLFGRGGGLNEFQKFELNENTSTRKFYFKIDFFTFSKMAPKIFCNKNLGEFFFIKKQSFQAILREALGVSQNLCYGYKLYKW